MLRNTFLKGLRDQGRSLFWWSVGLLAYVLMIFMFYPTIHENAEVLNQYLEVFPEAFTKAFLGDLTDLASSVGFLTAYIFSMMVPVMMLIYAIGVGAGAIAGEEERGTLDLLLANPISRRQVLLEKFATLLAGTAILAAVLWLGLWLGAIAVSMDISPMRLAEATLSMVLLVVCLGALALAAGAARGKRGVAAGLASAVAVVSYLINNMAPVAEVLETCLPLSLFYYYVGNDPLVNGLDPVHVAVLVGLTALFVVIGVVTFDRRDLAV